MPYTLPLLAVLAVSLLNPSAHGQESNPRESYVIAVSRRMAPPEAIHRHSSTFYEGAHEGEAAWITAAGEYMVDQAQAEILWQHAESLHYKNEVDKTATALNRKKMLNDFRDYERQRRFERKAASKQLWEEKYQELARTYRLNEYQFNWETGTIYWPTLVASPRYAKHRERLNVLLDRVIRYGDSDYGDSAYGNSDYGLQRDEIVKVCEQFGHQLREDFAQDHPSTRQEYADMQRFLLGLKYAPVLLQQGNSSPALAMR